MKKHILAINMSTTSFWFDQIIMGEPADDVNGSDVIIGLAPVLSLQDWTCPTTDVLMGNL